MTIFFQLFFHFRCYFLNLHTFPSKTINTKIVTFTTYIFLLITFFTFIQLIIIILILLSRHLRILFYFRIITIYTIFAITVIIFTFFLYHFLNNIQTGSMFQLFLISHNTLSSIIQLFLLSEWILEHLNIIFTSICSIQCLQPLNSVHTIVLSLLHPLNNERNPFLLQLAIHLLLIHLTKIRLPSALDHITYSFGLIITEFGIHPFQIIVLDLIFYIDGIVLLK